MNEATSSIHHTPGRRSALAPEIGLPGGSMAIALAMPIILQACGASAPAHATSTTPAAAGSAPVAAGRDLPAISGSAGSLQIDGPSAPIVRISLGWYPPEHEHEVAALLDYTNRSIGEAIGQLPGLRWYYSGIDRERHAIVNVSAWRDVPSAEQMSKLQAMLDLGADMSRLGVQFVRPIANFAPIWTFTGVSP